MRDGAPAPSRAQRQRNLSLMYAIMSTADENPYIHHRHTNTAALSLAVTYGRDDEPLICVHAA